MKFFLRSSVKSGKASLYFRVQKSGINALINSGIEVTVESWNDSLRSSSRAKLYEGTEEGKKVHEAMVAIEQLVKSLSDKGKLSTSEDVEALKKSIDKMANADADRKMEEAEKVEAEQKAKEQGRVLVYLDSFIEGMESGTIRKPNKDAYTAATIQIYRKTRTQLNKYLEKSGTRLMTFDGLSEKWVNGFVTFLNDNAIMPKTRGQYWGCLRHLTQKAVEEHICSDSSKIFLWRGSVVRDEAKVAEIALNDAEIDALYAMPLQGIREQVRDVWMIGMLLAQRVSDYGNLSRGNFIKTINGTDIVTLVQKKTGREVFIPVLDSRVMEIAAKYDYDFPKIDDRSINRYIKDICRSLAETVPTLAELIPTPLTHDQQRAETLYGKWCQKIAKGGRLNGEDAKRYRAMKQYAEEVGAADGMLYARNEKWQVVRFKWELVTSHTARRTGVTQMYESDLYSNKEIMSVSGHQSMKNFEGYLRMGGIALAEKIAAKKAQADKELEELREQKKIINLK